MKNLILISILLTSITMISFNCSPKKNAWLKSGSTLTYHLINGDNQYDFIVSDLIIEKDISFKWTMTEPANITGSVVINKNALDNATNIIDEFSDGTSLNMDKETTVWLSRMIYNNLKNQKPIDVKFDGNAETLNFKSNEKLKIKVNGADQEANVLYAESDKGHQLWILDEAQNPLIIKMQLGFTIELMNVVTGK